MSDLAGKLTKIPNSYNNTTNSLTNRTMIEKETPSDIRLVITQDKQEWLRQRKITNSTLIKTYIA